MCSLPELIYLWGLAALLLSSDKLMDSLLGCVHYMMCKIGKVIIMAVYRFYVQKVSQEKDLKATSLHNLMYVVYFQLECNSKSIPMY